MGGGVGGSKVLSSVHTFVSTRIKCAVCMLRFRWMCDIDGNKLVCVFTIILGGRWGGVVFQDWWGGGLRELELFSFTAQYWQSSYKLV